MTEAETQRDAAYAVIRRVDARVRMDVENSRSGALLSEWAGWTDASRAAIRAATEVGR